MRTLGSSLLCLALLTGCQPAPLPSPTINTEAALSEHTVDSSPEERWQTLHDPDLGIHLRYPPNFSVLPYGETFSWSGTTVRLRGVRIADGRPEGEGVVIYHADSPAILEYFQQDQPFFREVFVRGTVFQEFQFIGLASVYGYVTKKGNGYVVFESTWGPNNPVSERIFASLRFEGEDPVPE